MTSEKPFRNVLTGPITDFEPEMLKDLPKDNLVSAIAALAGEVYILRERLGAMESELVRARALEKGAVDAHEPEPQESDAIQADLDAFAARIWGELSRSLQPLSSVDREVSRYVKNPDSLDR